MKSRIVSIAVVTTIVALAFAGLQKSDFAQLSGLFVIIFPLALIWFSEPLGQYTGYAGRGGDISTPTPGILVAAVGWVLLVVLLVITAKDYFAHTS